ncbi:glycoside hydrolase [Rubricoccus marinus]|uniref:Glycoside hydrolase n=1 Tax=Rubricoccus marinus TaxID=716817 RepID=A0A259TUB9_9BACT|nr:glycoside hydrolase [Rubricoccus marinus]
MVSQHGALPGTRTQPRIPRWRGFNLTELTGGARDRSFVETDFEWIAELGFDFVRIPMSYWAWSSPEDWMEIDEEALNTVDEAVEYGEKYGLHVNLNLHRIPGYCVNGRELEPHLLFDSPREEMELAMDAATLHWQTLAERYKHTSNQKVSYDLFNEPPWSYQDQSRYVEVATRLVAAIRDIDPDRLIVADGADIGQTPVPGIVPLGLVQSTRGYLPKMISHYTATWVPENEFESFETPVWPMTDKDGRLWNKEVLREQLVQVWQPLVNQGVPVHVGEWGCYNKTPHEAALGWMRDVTSLWREMGWGWAMWNFRGSFGILDSGREDVAYEDFRGHKLDRRMADLLLSS